MVLANFTVSLVKKYSIVLQKSVMAYVRASTASV